MTTSTATRPLDGPFMSALQMLDYSADPGYAIRVDIPSESLTAADRALARLDRTTDAAA